MEKTLRRVVLANTFGTLGYLSVVFQWMWALLLFSSPLLAGSNATILQPQQPVVTQPANISPEMTPLLGAIAGIVTIFILVLTIITIIRLPKSFGKKAAITSKTTARAILPIVTHHKKVTKKQRVVLSYKIILCLKSAAIVFPLISLCFLPAIADLDPAIIWTIGLFAAAASLTYFATQSLVAHIGKIPLKQLW